MALIGRIENKKGNLATILVKKELPCGDNCRKCSAGCIFFGIYIQANVVEDIKPGDYETIIEKGSFVLDSRIMFYAISTIIIVGSVTTVQMFPCIQNKAKNFTVGEKHNPR